ncbi:hypothetical protein D7V21_10815 [Acinetobacter guerrae]|uniref:Uncharacterized protein n=1 Tax=Acinetobacter guerrae TaxID=1843371 RepID=A0A3A8EDJ3_9GAMM|nr:hypothetical protein D7V21_10815 [Acinetobacter guerrae]
MKYKCLFIFVILGSVNVYAEEDFFCFYNGKKAILLIPKNYPDISEVKYYPYLKSINLSKVIKTEYGDDGGENPEIYYTMNEIVNKKNTGSYTFMSQGYVVYNVTYLNFRTKKQTAFLRLYDYEIKLKNINCL